VIWAGNAQLRMAPASLTKMMSAIVTLEAGRLDEVVTVSRAASRETGSRIGLKAGDQLRVRDLLAAMIVRSANDACRAIADHFRRDVHPEALARYPNVDGVVALTHGGGCATDSAGQAMQHPEFARLARSERVSIATVDARRKFHFTTTNALLGRYEGAIGVKTGTTGRAGNCLVAIAERNGVRVVLVLLNAHNRWWNAAGVLDRAFEF